MNKKISVFSNFFLSFFLLVTVPTYSMMQEQSGLSILDKDVMFHIMYFITYTYFSDFEKLCSYEISNNTDSIPSDIINAHYTFLKNLNSKKEWFRKYSLKDFLILELIDKTIYIDRELCSLACSSKKMCHFTRLFKEYLYGSFFKQCPKEMSAQAFFMYAQAYTIFKSFIKYDYPFFYPSYACVIASAQNKKDDSTLRFYFDIERNILVLHMRFTLDRTFSIKKILSLHYNRCMRDVPSIIPNQPIEQILENKMFSSDFYKLYFNEKDAFTICELVNCMRNAEWTYHTISLNFKYKRWNDIMIGIQYYGYNIAECKTINLTLPTAVFYNLCKLNNKSDEKI